MNPEQFNLIKRVRTTHQYKQVLSIEQALQLEYNFHHNDYDHEINRIQFRLQQPTLLVAEKLCFFSS